MCRGHHQGNHGVERQRAGRHYPRRHCRAPVPGHVERGGRRLYHGQRPGRRFAHLWRWWCVHRKQRHCAQLPDCQQPCQQRARIRRRRHLLQKRPAQQLRRGLQHCHQLWRGNHHLPRRLGSPLHGVLEPRVRHQHRWWRRHCRAAGRLCLRLLGVRQQCRLWRRCIHPVERRGRALRHFTQHGDIFYRLRRRRRRWRREPSGRPAVVLRCLEQLCSVAGRRREILPRGWHGAQLPHCRQHHRSQRLGVALPLGRRGGILHYRGQ